MAKFDIIPDDDDDEEEDGKVSKPKGKKCFAFRIKLSSSRKLIVTYHDLPWSSIFASKICKFEPKLAQSINRVAFVWHLFSGVALLHDLLNVVQEGRLHLKQCNNQGNEMIVK